MMYFIWLVLVIGSVLNVTDINNYGYQSMALVIVSCLGCFRELLMGYRLRGL